jgi:hypothetical protein
MKTFIRLKAICDYLGGGDPSPSAAVPSFLSAWWFRGLWWGVLVGGILLFCGQTSKFIYIDF